MASPKSIPSKISGTAGDFTVDTAAPTKRQQYFYITAIIDNSGVLTIDGVDVGTPGPLNLSSPIRCSSFTTTQDGQVAYYQQ